MTTSANTSKSSRTQESKIQLTFFSPEILYNNVATNPERAALVKNTTMFFEDLKANTLPQWMFITPNMTSDGHDTSVTVAGAWLRNFLEPLLTDKNFMQNTLVLITFDENETYSIQNNIFSVLLGDAVPEELVGTIDTNYYNHYSEISTVEANWYLSHSPLPLPLSHSQTNKTRDLHTLGRWDVGANVFSLVASHTGDRLRTWTGDFSTYFFNYSYPGIFNTAGKWAPQPVPDVHSRRNGRTTLPAIKTEWESEQPKNYYHGQLEIPDGYHVPVYPFKF